MTSDAVSVWNAFLTFQGNSVKTAVSTGLSVGDVERMAEEGGWKAKIASLENSSGTGTSAASVNRAINYVQAHRLRSLLDRVVTEISTDAKTFDEYTQTYGKEGAPSGRTVKPLLELAKAVEVAQGLTQRALGDKGDALGDAGGGGGLGLSKVGEKVLDALARLDAAGGDSMSMVREELGTLPPVVPEEED